MLERRIDYRRVARRGPVQEHAGRGFLRDVRDVAGLARDGAHVLVEVGAEKTGDPVGAIAVAVGARHLAFGGRRAVRASGDPMVGGRVAVLAAEVVPSHVHVELR